MTTRHSHAHTTSAPDDGGGAPSAPAPTSSSQVFELPDTPPAESTETKPKLVSTLAFSGDAGAH